MRCDTPADNTLHGTMWQERQGYLRTLEDLQRQVHAKDAMLRRCKESQHRERAAHSREVTGLRAQLEELRQQLEAEVERRRAADNQVGSLRSQEVSARERLSAYETTVRRQVPGRA